MAAIQPFTVDTASPMTTNWTASDGSGLNGNGTTVSPPNYTADHASTYDGTNAPSTADQRIKVTVNFTTLGKFGLYARLGTGSDLTTDHIRVDFTPGSSTAPAFDNPDTFQIIERVSNVETAITPSNTPNAVPLLYPAWNATTKVFSLRGDRLTTGDTVELQVINDQVIVKVNDIIRAHEECNVDQAGDVGLISYDDVGADGWDNTYTAPKGGDLVGRYVDKDNGNDSNSGLEVAPWATMAKGTTAQVEGEVTFIIAGATDYSEQLIWHASWAGAPRIATTLEDPVCVMAKAGETVANVTSQTPWSVNNNQGDVRFMYVYNQEFRSTNSSGTTGVLGTANYVTDASYGHVFQGLRIYDGGGNGIHIGTNEGAGTGDEDRGDNWILDCKFKGNGREVGAQHHTMYLQTKNNRVEYNLVDGASNSYGASEGIGIQYFKFGGDTDNCSNGKIRYNEFKNHTHGTGVVCGILIANGTDMEVVGNRVHNNKNGIIAFNKNVDCFIENNEVFDNDNDGIDTQNTGHTGLKIFHNTVTGNGLVGITINSGNTNADCRNNITWNNGTDPVSDSGTTSTVGNNTTTDPDFTDDTLRVFTLNSGSGAIGAGDGTITMSSAIDKSGFSRPQDGDWDTGAYEYPEPPTNAPVVNMDTQYTGTPSSIISLSTVNVSDSDGDARNAFINITGSVTLAIDGTGVTVEGPA